MCSSQSFTFDAPVTKYPAAPHMLDTAQSASILRSILCVRPDKAVCRFFFERLTN